MQPILEGFESNGPRGQLPDYDIRHQIYSRNSRTATITRRKPIAYNQVLLSQNHSTRWQPAIDTQSDSNLPREQYTYGANFNTNFNSEFDSAREANQIELPKSEEKKNKENGSASKLSVPRRTGKTLPYRFLYRMRPSGRRHGIRNGEMVYMPPSNLIRLFGESSVPGVRDIALSRSFLRRVFWICSFFFFGFLALRDISQLVSEYYTYPITVDVRLRDSRRLQFPAVTVCNMNIVRYSALCVANLSVIKDSMIPRDLREKLCGIQPGTAVAATAATVTPPMMSTTSFTSVPQTASTRRMKPTHKTTKKKTPAPSMTNRTKANNTIITTTPSADSNEGLDDINNYGVISKDNKSLSLGNETNTSNNTILLKDTDSELDENGTSSLPSQSITVTMNSKLDDIPNDIAAPIAELDVPLSRPKRKVKPTGGGRAFENGTYFNNSFGQGENPVSQKPSAKGGEGLANSAKDSAPPVIDNSDIELTEREEKELQENLTNWLAVIYNSNEKIAKELGHQFEDFVLRCTIRSTNCTHANSFENFFTPTEGNCFTFKSQKLRKSYLEKIKDETSIAGVNYGLELVLNLEISEYLTGTAQIGAIIMIQHPDEIGNSASEAIFVAPQQSTYIGLKMVNISRLPKPYPEECIDHWPAALIGRLTQNASYSQQACLKICLQRTIHTRCDCQSAMLPQLELNSTLKICDTRRRNTRNCVEEVMFQAEEKVSTCKCPPRCQVVNYDKTVSMTRWPTREEKVTFDRGKTNINFQNLAKVTVYFQTMTCQEVRQEKAYTTAKLFSSLGGILGMYVGFSFLSLFEILEIFVRRFWYLITKKKSRFRAAVHTITATLALNQKRPTPTIGYFNKSSRRSRLNASQSLVAARQLGRLSQPSPPIGPL